MLPVTHPAVTGRVRDFSDGSRVVTIVDTCNIMIEDSSKEIIK